MNLEALKNAITSRLGQQILTGKKHAPAILFGVGVVGVVTTVVLACRSTLKVGDILDEAAEDLEKARSLEHSSNSEVAKVYAKTAGRIAVLYGPAVAVGVASISALTGAHLVLTRRNLALTAAYAALDKGFRQYRERVVAELGEDKDREFRHGSELRTIEVDDGQGIEKKQVSVIGSDEPSIYARWFDDSCTPWQRQPEYNRIFLKCQQNFANDLLNSRGWITLNEVYDSLGMKRTRAGMIVGWVKNGKGDGFVDFGIFNPHSYDTRDFVNGWQDRVLLDFNVDGVIFDQVKS